MPIFVDKFYFLILYWLCDWILGPLLYLIGFKYNMRIISFLSNFAPLPAILYLSSFSKSFKDQGIIYFILRSFFRIIEEIYFAYNMLFSKSLYSGFNDVYFSPSSIKKSFYLFISVLIIHIFIIFYILSYTNSTSDERSEKEKDASLKVFFPKIRIIKKLVDKYRNKDN
jgi:hypothetical protein